MQSVTMLQVCVYKLKGKRGRNYSYLSSPCTLAWPNLLNDMKIKINNKLLLANMLQRLKRASRNLAFKIIGDWIKIQKRKDY